MPKDVFYKIPKDRQYKLIKPAIKEFTRKPYDKINVTSLTDTMKILRTDFYYYFLDKDDLFSCIIDIFKESINYSSGMSFNEAKVLLLKKVQAIPSARTKAFALELTETYDTNFADHLSNKIINIFNFNYSKNVSFAKVKCEVLEFMTILNLTLKKELAEQDAINILTK